MAAVPIRLQSSRHAGMEPDLELAAYLYLPPSAKPYHRPPLPGLVVGHGASSLAARHERFCLAACEAGFAVLALDFRGHGRSGGASDGPLENDVIAGARFLRGHPAVDPHLICYRGSSMGGFYGLKAAPDARFAALVLICPAGEGTMLSAIGEGEDATSIDTEAPDPPSQAAGAIETAGGAAPTLGKRALTATGTPAAASAIESTTRWDLARAREYFQNQDSFALAAQIAVPVLLVHARGDEVVPLEHSLGLARRLRGDTTLLVLRGGGHTSAQHDPAVHAYSLAWLNERVEEARATRE